MKKYPLSKTEYGIYIEQTSRGDCAYNLPFLIGLPDGIDTAKFEQAVTAVVQNHQALLTSFGVDEKGEVFKYHCFDTVQIEHINTDAFEPYDFVAPFDLHHDCLCRFFIVTTPKGRYFFFDIHHIIFDGTSVEVFLTEINQAYQGVALDAEAFSADDFAEDEKHRLDSEAYVRAKQYYQSVFDGVDTNTAFFTDRNERKSGSVEMVYSFESVDSDALKAVARMHGVRLSTVFNAAFSFLLSRYTNSPQVLYSTVHHGRDERVRSTVGMFVKTYPVYAELSDDKELDSFLKELDAHIEANRKNDLYAFADFCADFRLNPSVLFAYQGDMFQEMDFCGGREKVKLLPMKDPKSGFELTIWRENGEFTARAEYDPSLYNDEVIRTMLESFDKILFEMLSAKKLADIDMLTEQQREKIEKNNQNESDYEITDIVTLFRRQAEETPDNTAVVYLDREYTYRELDRISGNIAGYLKKKKIGRGDVVSVLIERSEYMPIASLGILKTGAGYQPLDPSYPVERLEFMVKDADAKYLIADRSLMDRLPHYDGDVLFTDEIPALPDADKLSAHPAPADLFIMLYTSGSTGVPKGVMLEHSNLCCFCEWYRSFYQLEETSRVAAYASYGFDANMMDMYPALTTGAAVHIIAEEIRLDLLAIKDYFERNQITHSFMTTQVARQYADLFPDAKYPHYLSSGGEKLVPIAPPTGYRFYNGYGPTECTIFTNVYLVDRLYERVPIGRPLDNLKQYVVDNYLRILPFDVPGELVIAGHQVGRGYLNRPEQKAFIQNPFTDKSGYERAYRTGDIVRMLPDGTIDFVGRNDGQVKIRGFRIELSEVEEIIRRFEGIRDATVQAFDEAGGGKFIAAYVVSDKKVDIEAMNAFIRANKPPYMIPAVTMQIDRIPLNQNQKVNKRALPVPEKETDEIVAPETEVQQKIFDCVAEVIGSNHFGTTTDIFDAGLTSIGAIKLNVLLSSAFDVPVSIQDLRKNSTVLMLEKFLTEADIAKTYELQSDYPITRTQNGIFVACVASPGTTMYNIPFLISLGDGVDTARLKKAVNTAFAVHPYLHTTLFLNDKGDIRAKRNNDTVTVGIVDCDKLPAQEELVRPYQLLGDRLCRAVIYQTKAGNYLFLDFHHIIFDGVSAAVLFRDIADAYDGKTPETESFTGFEAALEEEENRQTDRFAKAKGYYDSIFKGCDSDCLPKPDRNDTVESSGFLTKQTKTPIEPFRSWCQQNGVTLNAFNTTQGFIVPEGREVTVDLNGHTIDCSAFGGIKLFDVQKGAIFTLQNGQVNSAASAINYSSHDKAKTGICVEDVKINHCSGTAIFFDGSNPSDNLTIKNCMISGSQKGGMVWKWRLKYMISDTTFADNHAEYGAAIKGIYAEDGSFVRNCKFTGNTADKAAGALYCVSGVSNCTFENNKAGTYGGACAGWTEVFNSTFIGNSAGSDGGAVWTQNDVINCTFKNNKAGGEGGAVYVQPRLQTIRNCTFENNHAFKGGALTFELDGSKAVNCTFRNNSADSDGGALFIRSNEDGTVSGCVFDGNKAGVDGGAICASCHAKLMADNTTITGNRAGCNGGGIYLGALTTSNHHLTNVTITGNSANHGGGIYCSAGAFKAADTCLHGIVNIKDNNGDNAYLVNDSGKKALLYTKGDFDRSNSTVYVSSSSRSDIAVVDLDSKSHESSFHADYGRRLYRGTMYNGTLYLDDM